MATDEGVLAAEDGMFLYIGTYPSEAAARDDYDVVRDLHSADGVGTFDAAVITKHAKGKVHVNKDEMATRHGGWGGAAAGAVVGMLSRRHSLAARSWAGPSARRAVTCGVGSRGPM